MSEPRNSRVLVGATPVLLAAGPDEDFNPDYRDAMYTNLGPVTVYLGGPNVTTEDGWPLSVNATISQDRVTTDALLWAVASESCEVAVLEAGV